MNIFLISNEAWPSLVAAFDPLRHKLTFLQQSAVSWPALQAQVVAGHPDLVFLGDLAQSPAQLEQLESLCAALPAVAVVLLCKAPASDFLIQAMRAGVREVIASNETPVLVGVLARVQQRLALSKGAKRTSGRCWGVMSAKGGDGASVLTANLAAELAKNTQTRVLLVDLSLPFGDVDLLLSREPAVHDLSDFTSEIERLDAELLEVMTQHLTDNFHLIRSLQSIDKLLHVKPSDVERLIRMALLSYDHVVLDMGLDAVGLSVMDQLSLLIVVATPNVSSVRRASQIIQMWVHLGYPAEQFKLVLKLSSSRPDLSLEDVEHTVGRRVSCSLPHDAAGLHDSLLQGAAQVRLKPKSEFARTLAAWVAELTGQSQPAEVSLWHRLGIR